MLIDLVKLKYHAQRKTLRGVYLNMDRLSKMLSHKKGAGINTGTIQTAILGIVLLVVLFQLYADLVPTAQDFNS